MRDPDGTPVSQRTSTSKQFFLADQLGSTLALTDSSGSIVRSYTYDPDGNDTSSGTGAQTDLKYASGHTLPGGLIHFGARFYDPASARWTQQDPLQHYTDLRQANRYTYAGCNPINMIDVTGLSIGDIADDIYSSGKDVVEKTSSVLKRTPRPVQGCIVGGAVGAAAFKTPQGAAGGCLAGAVIFSIKQR